MKDFDRHVQNLIPDDAIEEGASVDVLESQLDSLRARLDELADTDVKARVHLLLEMGRLLVALERAEEAWRAARAAFDLAAGREDWQHAVEACEILFLSDQPGSLSALGQGVWLAVTFPIKPELTVNMLQHIVEDTPDDSDGAAVAAATATYIVDLRAAGNTHRDLSFLADQLLSNVAKRHSQVKTQQEFDAWMKRLELDDRARFLPRLRNVVDVLVQDDWWFDREALQAKLPVN